jgi:biopolymer transport protein ExbD
MKFQTNVRIFRGNLDSASFLGLLFVLALFLMVHGTVSFTPGVKIALPEQDTTTGVSGPNLAVAVDAAGQMFCENQIITEPQLAARMKDAIGRYGSNMVFIIQADASLSQGTVIDLSRLARQAGFREVVLATRPKVFAPGSPQ